MVLEAMRPAAVDADEDAALGRAQEALAAEWQAAAPTTPSEIQRFYVHSQAQAADQAAWHATPARRSSQLALCKVAEQAQVQRVVDIGCGAGFDLAALRVALPGAHLHGVEPNIYQRRAAADAVPGVVMHDDVLHATIEDADLLVCVDVLEHLPDPEAFLGAVARRAKLGALFYETTATHDMTTPLHLRSNAGWHPGRVLDRHGWQLCSTGGGRNRVWRRERVAAPPRAAVLLCAYRAVSVPTLNALLQLTGRPSSGAVVQPLPWRIITKSGDGLIARSRSILVSRWWQETSDDVALFVDDDVVFTPDDAERIMDLCRAKRSIVCGAYPVGDATHFALRAFDDTGEIAFHDEAEPIAIQYGATGFMALHRDVIDAMMPTLPWVHANQTWAFKTLFDTATVPMGETLAYVSEDWEFSRKARELGFTIWLDPRLRIGHLKETEIHVTNMAAMAATIQQGK